MYAQPDDIGTFPIRCAEYCGLDHSKMQGFVDVVAPEGETCEVDTGVKKSQSDSSQSDNSDGGGY
jgi:heme/copper-type cytochrome/quinol oxidase subunit 2